MGKDLHRSIPPFIENAVLRHSKVVSFRQVPDDNDYVYVIERRASQSNLYVHLSDAYFYTLNEFFSRPEKLRDGGFVLIARPEAKYSREVAIAATEANIGIGKLKALMGALNYSDLWKYIPSERAEEGKEFYP